MKPRSGGIELWYANVRKEADIMNSLTVEQIQEIIPHRHPFLLLERIEAYVDGKVVVSAELTFMVGE